MANWIFNAAEYEEHDYSPIPEGDHRARISSVTERTFSSGNEGFEIVFEISGYNSKVWYYLVLNPADSKRTNQRIGSLFDSFGITDHNLANFRAWEGKVGAVRIRHEDYNGSPSAKVHFCIEKRKQDALPAWKEPGAKAAPVLNTAPAYEDLPFA